MISRHSLRWKQFLQLQKPSQRREHGLFLVEGPKLLAEALRGRYPVQEVFFDPERFEPTLSLASRCWPVTSAMLDRVSEAHQGVVAVAQQGSGSEPQPWEDRVLLCDGVSDPGNLGGLLRSAWAAGLTQVVTLAGVDPFHPKVVRASAGALFHLTCLRINDPSQVEDRCLIGLAPRGGEDLYQLQWPQRWALVVGNESHGLSPLLESRLQRRCSISMDPGCESLNAGVAAAIVLFEWRRQRQRH